MNIVSKKPLLENLESTNILGNIFCGSQVFRHFVDFTAIAFVSTGINCRFQSSAEWTPGAFSMLPTPEYEILRHKAQ
jgi:hypothetical protein